MKRTNASKPPLIIPVETQSRELVAKHVASLNGNLASDRILDVLDRSVCDGSFRGKPAMDQYSGGWARAKSRAAGKQINSIIPNHKNNWRYQHRRFPGVTLADVQDRIGRFNKLLGRFDNLSATQFSRKVFRITAE